MSTQQRRSASSVSSVASDVSGSANGAEASESRASLPQKGKYKILELIDGILIEPGSYDHGDDDDGTDGSTAVSASEMGELLSRDVDLEVSTIGTSNEAAAEKWICPGATADGASCDAPGQDPRCTHSYYGRKPDKDALEREIGEDKDGGLLYKVLILPNDYDSGKKIKFVREKDYNDKAKQPKPRRKMPFPITAANFFSSITRVGKPSVEVQAEGGYDDLWDRDVRHSMQAMSIKKDESTNSPPRWIFSGVINGWPGFQKTPLQILKIESRESRSFVGRRMGWSTLWDSNEDGKEKGKDPSYSKSDGLEIRVRLRAAPWSAHGWRSGSPGFVFWVQGQTCAYPDGPLTVTYGTDLISHFKCDREEDDPLVKRVHMISHRYATGGRKETPREQLTYHTLVLLEWNHQEYCTVVEIGYLNGVGGYKGKSNWYVDKDAPQSRLCAAMPPEMILPWKETMSEIRIHDVPHDSYDSFLAFMQQNEGHTGRFVDIRPTFSHEARLTYRSRRNVATYLLNYIRRDQTYSEIRRNCQTFAADLCGFLCGKRDVAPFHPVNQVAYTNQKHYFLYEPLKY